MRFKDGIQRYCIAIVSTLAATQIRLWIDPWVGDHVPFGTYMVAVVLTAWMAGSGPAIVTLLLGIIAAAYYFIAPTHTLFTDNPHALVSLVIYGIVGVVTISLFNLVSRQHNLAREQLKQIRKLTKDQQISDRRKDEFLALLAHELRNPLAPIRSGLMLLQSDHLGEEEHGRTVKTLCRQLRQLIRIVDDLLDVSRFMHDKIVLECHPVDLRELVETAIEQAQPDFKDRAHEVQLLMPARVVPVHGDRVRIVQVITNLLTNASKYTPRQGRIQILLEINANAAQLSVTDNGIGITREMQQYIFELFARSAAAMQRDQGGLGLGLPIAKRFTDMHGGTLRAFSEGADRGSRFELNLPLISADQLRSPDRGTNTTHSEYNVCPGPVEPPADPQKPRVMIVDDNVDAAETLSILLGMEGYEVVCVNDGFQALTQVSEFRPDIVLLDIGLPGMDGYEVARRLREEFILQPLLLIAVTGWGGDEDLLKSRQAGIDHHLVKPVDPEALSRLMRSVTTSLPSS
ncbi:MAG: ATP-binding protein [Planctomycetaceae bacterium]|nr:response regulator [Planctomycetaceae bacterium]